MDMTALTSFLGWTLLLHVVLLLVMAMFMTVGRGAVIALHQKLLGMDEAALIALYVQTIGQYKILVLVFSAVPYLALKLLGS
ncbi:MAG: hypothetical protein Hals2KO_18060 [Halioglobus sp.]